MIRADMSSLSEEISSLSPEQRALLEHLLKKEGVDISRFPIPRLPRTEPLPLSLTQERVWAVHHMTPDVPADNLPLAFQITGDLDVQKLKKSLNEVIKRHEILRTNCCVVDGEPRQKVNEFKIDLDPVDLSHIPDEFRLSGAIKRAAREVRRPFDLVRDPLFRASLFKLGQEVHLFLLTAHQFLVDGWSMQILLTELSALYKSGGLIHLAELPELTIQFADFALWQKEHLTGEVLDKQAAYWGSQLADAPSELKLPFDRFPTRERPLKGATKAVRLTKNLSSQLKSLSRGRGVTLFMTLLAGFQAVLHRYTGQSGIVVGAPVSNRTREESQNLIGNLSNNLLLRADFSSDPSLCELLDRMSRIVGAAYAHQEMPIEKLSESSKNGSGILRFPKFQVMLILREGTPEQYLDFPGLTVTRIPVSTGATRLDLSLDLSDAGDHITGFLEYKTELFDADTIGFLIEDFKTLLRAFTVEPDQRISRVPIRGPLRSHSLPTVDSKKRSGENGYVAPRDELETQLADLWRKNLGVRRVGIRDNFFGLGGHSLLAVSLFGQIERSFGRNLPLATLVRAQTVEELAQILQWEDMAKTWSSLVEIQGSGERPPFFCVHGAGGNVLIYRALSKHLGESQPFYGLQCQGLHGRQPYLSSIEDMAAHYVKEIQEVQPTGPYLLGGYCMGGTVAFEMAQQLSSQGHKVALLALFDCYNVRSNPDFNAKRYQVARFFQRMGFHLGNMSRLDSGGARTFLLGKTEVAQRRLKTGLLVGAARVLGRLNFGGWKGSEVRLRKMNDRAYFQYVPRVYPGKLTVFRPSKSYLGLEDPQLGWGGLASAGLEVHTLPVYPAGMMVEPFVSTLSTGLTESIEEALVDCESRHSDPKERS